MTTWCNTGITSLCGSPEKVVRDDRRQTPKHHGSCWGLGTGDWGLGTGDPGTGDYRVGISNPTSAPPPLAGSANTSPPWASTICFTMERPRPEPGIARAEADR